MAEVFESIATFAGKHSGEGVLRKLIKTVRQWEVLEKDNGAEGGTGQEVGGKPWQLGNRKRLLTMLEIPLG